MDAERWETILRLCDNCLVKPKRRGGKECSACAGYRQRTGRSRPLYLIERDVEKTSRQQGPA